MSVRGVGVAVVVAVLLGAPAGCSLERSGYQFLRNPATGTYLKVPSGWTVYDREAHDRMLEAAGQSVENVHDQIPYIASFFEEPVEDGKVGLQFRGDTVSGQVSVRYLTLAERDAMSFATLREELLPLSEMATAVVRQQRREDIEMEGGFRGQRVVFTITGEQAVYTVDQTTLLDRSTTRVYLLAFGCKAECYEANEDQIEAVARSLTLKET